MDSSVESLIYIEFPASILRGARYCSVKSQRQAFSRGVRDCSGATLELSVAMDNDYDNIIRRCCGPQ
jgi:hypothetical protein